MREYIDCTVPIEGHFDKPNICFVRQMTLEPNTIPAGYLRRWLKEAVAMLWTNLSLWMALGLIVIITMLSVGTGNIPAVLSLMILGYFGLHLSFEVALVAEHGYVQPAQLAAIIAAAIRGTAELLWRQRLQHVALFVFMGVWHLAVAPYRTGTPSPQPELTWQVWLFGLDSPLLAVSVAVFLGAQGTRNHKVMGNLAYPLARMHGLDVATVDVLLFKGRCKNVLVAVTLDVLSALVPMFAIVGAPLLAPLLLWLLPALCYVACREMFGPGAPPLQTRQTKTVCHHP
jgi:hypothetical protein